MAYNRRSGIICHPTSFPGPHGIGDFGESAFRYIEWLARGAQSMWQVLPLGPVGLGDSPYASPSAFAGNPLLISLPWLAGDGLLERSKLDDVPPFASSRVDYAAVRAYKDPLLREAFDRFRRGAGSQLRGDFDAFCAEEKSWLGDFSLFMALRDAHGGQVWSAWPGDIALRQPEALEAAQRSLADEIRFH